MDTLKGIPCLLACIWLPNASGADWQLIWQDEFNGQHLDTTKWEMANNCWGGGNNERQCYTPRPDNVRVKDGSLVLTAKKEAYTGPAEPVDFDSHDPEITRKQPFTSGRVRSRSKGDWTYGRFEVRAKIPGGQGVWPAIWMLPTQNTYGGWAASGEIDIMEAVNLGTPSDATDIVPGTPETRVHGTLHYGASHPDNVYSGAPYRLPEGQSPREGFHVYSVEWQPGEIRWYVDAVHFATQTSDTWFTKSTQAKTEHAPFDHPFHFVLNLAIGGGWPEATNDKGVDETGFPKQMEIDYVRVYQCSSGSTDDCATRQKGAVRVTEQVTPNAAPASQH